MTVTVGVPRALAARPARTGVVRDMLRTAPPIVTPDEIDRLQANLAAAAHGHAMLVEIAESRPDFQPPSEATVRATVAQFSRVATVFAFAGGRRVVAVRRVGAAGPVRSGPDPAQLIRHYAFAAGAMNLLRALCRTGATAPLSTVDTVAGAMTNPFATGLHRAMRFATSVATAATGLDRGEVYLSQDATLLNYERGLLRVDRSAARSRTFAGSAHLVSIRPPVGDPARIAFGFAGLVANPVGMAVGPEATAAQVAHYASRLDPDRVPGRLVLACGLGRHQVRDRLPVIVAAVSAAGHRPVWQCDPAAANQPDRADDVLDEYAGFLDVHRQLGTHAGGIRLDASRATPLTGVDLPLRLAEVLHG